MPVSAEMIAYLGQSVVLCTVIKITEIKPDGSEGDIIRVCTFTRNLLIDGELYQSIIIQESQLQQLAGLEPDNQEITALLTEVFSAQSLRNKKWYGAEVITARYNPLDVSMGALMRRKSFVGKTDLARYTAKAEARSLAQLLEQPVGDATTAKSTTQLGDSRCKVDLTGTTVDGYKITMLATVTGFTDRQQFTVALTGEIKSGETVAPNDFYAFGNAIWIGGDNESQRIKILSNTGNDIILWLPTFYDIQIGDELTLIAGCDQTREMCRDKYANMFNFRGFSDIPGPDKIFDIPQSPNG
jgi:uncharacterized phage protein (TIGR02218 family)